MFNLEHKFWTFKFTSSTTATVTHNFYIQQASASEWGNITIRLQEVRRCVMDWTQLQGSCRHSI